MLDEGVIRAELCKAEAQERKMPRLITLCMLNAVFIKKIDEEDRIMEFLDAIDLPRSYRYQVKSFVKVPEELEKLGYEIRRIKCDKET